MKRVVLLVGIAVLVLLIGVLALPIREQCPAGPCASGLDAQGNVSYYYEVKPLGMNLIEILTGSYLPFHYTSGYELKKVQ